MKNRKGFTLTEIVATLVIVGILLLIAIPTYFHFTEKFEKEYYEKKFSTIEKAATTYFQDNKIELPSDLLNSYSTDINTLVDNKYIDNEAIKKYKSNDKCTGWIVTVKKEDSYKKQLCMDCGNYKSYSSDETSCDKAWITDENNNSTYDNINDSFIKPEVDTSDIYIYYDSDKNAIDKEINKSKLKYSYNLYKCDSNDDNCKKLDQVTQTINEYPINYQNLDLTKTSSNQGIKYKRDNSKRRVIVYRHNVPIFSNNKSSNDIYLDNDKLYLKMSDIESFSHNSLIWKYQYSFDKKTWYTACEFGDGVEVKNEENTKCNFNALSLVNKNVYFRVVGKNNNNEEFGIPTEKITINKLIEVSIPTDSYCKSNLVYDGTKQTLIDNDNINQEGFTWISEISQIKAGRYTVTAKLKDNYVWKGGLFENQSIDCTIKQKEISVNWENKTTFEENGNYQAPGASVKTGILNENMTLSISGKGKTVGNYTAKASCSSVTNSSCNNYILTNTTKEFNIKVSDTSLQPPVIQLSSEKETASDITFTINNPNSDGIIQYSIDCTVNYVNYSGETTLLSTTGVKKVCARIKSGSNYSSVSNKTGYCDKDAVNVSPNILAGTYFALKFSNKYTICGTSGYEYAYWNAEGTNDTSNKQANQWKDKCGTTPPTGAIKYIDGNVTTDLYMKYKQQYYCFAVRPYRESEISGINRWTVQRKHAITSQNVNSSKYNGYN